MTTTNHLDNVNKHYCYVFNCENVNEHITSNNVNTLVQCYKFKPVSVALETYQTFLKECETDLSTSKIEQFIEQHTHNMIVSIPLNNIQKEMFK